MKKYIVSIILVLSVFTQNTVSIITNNSPTSLRNFEHDFIKQVVNLFNAQNENKLKLKFVYKQTYNELFNTIKESRKSKFICAIRAITITENRKEIYDFSYPYMPIKQVLITMKTRKYKINNWKNSKYTIYANKRTVHWVNMLKLVKKYSFKMYKPNANEKRANIILSELRENKIDFYVGDMIDVLNYDFLSILDHFEGALLSEYGMIYPKGSTLKTKLDKYIKYFVKSRLYYKLLVKHFGQDIANYFSELSIETEKTENAKQ